MLVEMDKVREGRVERKRGERRRRWMEGILEWKSVGGERKKKIEKREDRVGVSREIKEGKGGYQKEEVERVKERRGRERLEERLLAARTGGESMESALKNVGHA